MKEYQSLRVLSYDDPVGYQKVAEQRKESDSALVTSLAIYPFDSQRQEMDYSKKYELFYVQIPKISFLKDSLNENSRKILELLMKIPLVVQQKVFYRHLIDEIQATNEIEGVRSTRKEIKSAIENILEKAKDEKRFAGLVRLYLNFQNEEFSRIQSIEDFRTLYDQLLEGEVEEEDLLKESLFREDPVSITKGTKVVHRGVPKEDEIKASLSHLVSFMNGHSVPALEKCFISHYYFEYIHPFYDGNGRTGRFIVCSYLARKLDLYSAINFSSSIIKNKNAYGKAFAEVSNPRNFGEITLFIVEMLNFIDKGQKDFIEQFSLEYEQYESFLRFIFSKTSNDGERLVLKLYVERIVFGFDQSVTDQEVADCLYKSEKLSRRKIDEVLKKLVQDNILIQVKKKPSIHEFSETFAKKLEKGIV